MKAHTCLALVCLAASLHASHGFMNAARLAVPSCSARVMRMSADVAGTMESAFKKIEADQALRPSDHAEALELDTFSVGDVSGTIAGFLGTKVDWCSKVAVKGPDGAEKHSLSYDVPHLAVELSKGGGTLTLRADIIAKDDTMYSQDYLESYYGGDTLAWYESLTNSPLTTPQPAPATLRGRALASPTLVHVTADDSAEAAALFAGGVDAIVDMWLGWLEDAAEIARVRRGTMLSRDNILRRMSWAVNCKDPAFGDLGQEIATAIAGPGDMAYVGQYS